MTFLSFTEIEAYLAALPLQMRQWSERHSYVERVLELLGNPQDAAPTIHIAGTSGKGSTAYYAAHTLRLAGYTVGLMVSPHVYSIAERSQINGLPLPEAEYCEAMTRFIELLAAHNIRLTYIEHMTVFSFWLFADRRLDYSVVEVGIGGRLDITNHLHRNDKVAVITDIGFDHTELLGDTLPGIAAEKAGIITPHADVALYKKPADVQAVIERAAADKQAALIVVAEPQDHTGFTKRNQHLGVTAAMKRLERDGRGGVTLPQDAATLYIPGRFEQRVFEGARVVLDAAHNGQKMKALVEALEATYPESPLVFCVALGENKTEAAQDVMEQVAQSDVAALFATRFIVPGWERRSMTQNALGAAARLASIQAVYEEVNPYEAFHQALRVARQQNAVLVVTGSFYLIAQLATAGGFTPEVLER